jgi:hypothetical protein
MDAFAGPSFQEGKLLIEQSFHDFLIGADLIGGQAYLIGDVTNSSTILTSLITIVFFRNEDKHAFTRVMRISCNNSNRIAFPVAQRL